MDVIVNAEGRLLYKARRSNAVAARLISEGNTAVSTPPPGDHKENPYRWDGSVWMPDTERRAEISRAQDVKSLSTHKAALVLIELVDRLLATGTIQANDFTPSVRQAYQDVKTIADRVKG